MREIELTNGLTARRSVTRDTQATAREEHGIAERPDAAVSNLESKEVERRSTDSGTMVYADPASHTLAKLLARIAPSDVPVTINGDMGTGKSAVARHIHAISGRRGRLVSVNCRAVAYQLAEGEALAGGVGPDLAPARVEAWFEAAHHGTLFLDEIADLPASLQGQLLRVLQENEALHAGVRDPHLADVRLVAATTIELREAVAAGHFRLELFYRLNVGQIRLLPLAQRRGDVAALARHFLSTYARRLSLPTPLLSEQAMTALSEYSWPGNIRELENVIRFALLVTPEQEVGVEHLKLSGAASTNRQLHTAASSPSTPLTTADTSPGSLKRLLTHMFATPGKQLLGDLECQIVAEAFRFSGRNQVQAAALLGISRNVLRTLLRKHGLFTVRHRKAHRNGTRGEGRI